MGFQKLCRLGGVGDIFVYLFSGTRGHLRLQLPQSFAVLNTPSGPVLSSKSHISGAAGGDLNQEGGEAVFTPDIYEDPHTGLYLPQPHRRKKQNAKLNV